MPLIAVNPATFCHFYPGSPQTKLKIDDSLLPEHTVKFLGEGLSIIFEDVPFTYTTGDVVRGHVQLHCPRQRNVSNIQLNFICQARTRGRIWTGETNDETGDNITRNRCGYVTYWNEYLQPTESEDTFPPGTYRWPFVVKIPTTCTTLCEPDMFGKHGFANSKHYSTLPGIRHRRPSSYNAFPMPGTFHHKTRKDSALIEYVVLAQANEIDGSQPELQPKYIATLCPIRVRQKNPLRLSLTSASTLASSNVDYRYMSILLKGKGESSFAFKLRKNTFQILAGKLYRDHRMSFKVSLTYPCQLELPNAQTPLPLMMKVTPSGACSALFDKLGHVPLLHLVWVEIRICTEDSWRPDEIEAVSHDNYTGITNPRRQLVELEAEWQGKEQDRVWEVDLGSLLNTSIIPTPIWSAHVADQILPYTFHTPNISRRYRLDWKLCFRTEDVGETVLSRKPSDIVSPAIRFSPLPDGARSTDSITLAAETVNDDEPLDDVSVATVTATPTEASTL